MNTQSVNTQAPSFENAANKKQKARSAGLDPNYWYAVEWERAVPKGKAVEVQFWRESVALYRDDFGNLHAIENRCSHRQLKLSLGIVEGDRLVCPYHGWGYDGTGKLVHIPHELFGKKMLNCKLRNYPVKTRYGLIWIFFGDPARANEVSIPDIPELEGDDRWACVPVDFTWRAHHSMIIDNVSDFTHAYLHRKFRPFWDAKLTQLDTSGDQVRLTYDTKIGRGRITKLFVDHKNIDTDSIELCYQYPYQWSNTGNQIKHWCFVLPMDERTTRSFFLFYFSGLQVPLVSVPIPRKFLEPILRISKELHIKPLLKQDGFAVEAEQEGYDRYFNDPIAELNPAVHAFQALTVRKWEEYLARKNGNQQLVELGRGRSSEMESQSV